MHEWALAEAVISTVERLYEENGRKKVLSVEVLIGELQHIEMEVFSLGLQNLLAERPFAADVFHFEIEKASFRCNACGNEWLLEQHADLGEDEQEAIHGARRVVEPRQSVNGNRRMETTVCRGSSDLAL